MATLNDLRMEQIRPLILAVLDTFMPGEVSKTLKLMVSWSVRLLIVGGLGGGVVENMYSDLAMRVRSGGITTAAKLSDEAKNIPTDLQFRTEFSTARVSKANLARYYLRTLERRYNGQSNPPLVPNVNTEAVNLEHILPQTPSSAWSHIDTETAREYYNRLGNLTLMESRMNSVAGNSGFSEKKRHYASSAFSLTSQLSKESDWGVAEIDARQSMLADLAVVAWSVRV